jgi:hemin uptake protein HemP
MRIIIIRIKNNVNTSIEDLKHQGELLPENYVPIRQGASLRQMSSADLLGNGDSLTISHQGECYILRQTRAGKLILTK